jgi:hypothetical protein
MARLAIFFRLLTLFVFSAVPLAGVGALAGGRLGAVIGAAGTYCLWVVIGMRAETWLIRAHHAREARIQGLSQAFERIGIDPKPFRIMVYPDPSPNALIARSPISGRGLLLLSQGLFASLNELELRAVLSECAARLESPGLGMATYSAALCFRLLTLAPGDWVDAARGETRSDSPDLSPSGFLVFSIMVPWVSQLRSVAERWRLSATRSRPAAPSEAWKSAERKIATGSHPSVQRAPAGTGALYLRCSTPEGGIIPL